MGRTLMKTPEPDKAKSKRPGSVVVAGWCAILAVPLILLRITFALMSGQLATFAAQSLTEPSEWLSTEGLSSLPMIFGAPLALISLVTGIAILRLKRWAWVVLMSFLVVALLLNLLRSYFDVPDYGLMLIYAVLALILNQPDVRNAFRIGRPRNEPVE
jgi:hypothetical protein